MLLIAVPIQSQTPTRLTNPTGSDIDACGLPTTWAQFDGDATVTTFNMTADCAFSSSNVGSGAFLYFSAGEFTINGNGHSIIGPSNTWTIYVENAGTVLNLNNVTIRGNASTDTTVTVRLGARLNARSVIFRDNTSDGATLFASNGEAYLEDAQFLGNSATINTGIVVSSTNGLIVITNGVFRANRSDAGEIIFIDSAGSFRGSSLAFSDNSAKSVITATEPNTRVTLQNARFLDNSQIPFTEPRGSAVTARSQSMVTITNGIFRANQNTAGRTDVIVSFGGLTSPGIVQLQGCVTFESNVQSDGSTAANDYGAYDSDGIVSLAGRIIDSRGSCPKRKKKGEASPTPTPTPRPAYGASYVALQTATGMTFEATYGLDSGVHFRQLDGAGIGVQSIIDAGYLAALDVYGYVEQGVEVCFPQIGRVIFLDARTMPRAIVPLDSTIRNGMICVSINSPGSLVLMPN